MQAIKDVLLLRQLPQGDCGRGCAFEATNYDLVILTLQEPQGLFQCTRNAPVHDIFDGESQGTLYYVFELGS